VAVADPRRLKQIVVNLLGNAVKFTPAGGQVNLRAGLADGALWVEVQDTGCGIAPEHQQLIFQKFGRVPQTGQAVEGTGLGLSLVSELVRLHGGQISLASAPGQGSTFKFTIPQGPQADARETPP
jgi:signal transduction histidine kinase